MSGIVSNAQGVFDKGAHLPVSIKKVNSGIELFGKKFNLGIFASGDFPNTGKLFVAKEAESKELKILNL